MTPTAMAAFAPLESPHPVEIAEAGAVAVTPLALFLADAAIGVQICSQLDAKSEIRFDVVPSVAPMDWSFAAAAQGQGA